MNRFYVIAIGFFLLTSAQAQSKKNRNIQNQDFSSIEKASPFKGFFDFYYEESADKIYLKVSQIDQEFLYVNSLSQGIGNNDIGLDRGQLGNERIVYFKKAGNKLLLIQPNLRYRSTSENPLEQRSIQEAFAKSVLFGFPIIETLGTTYLIDLTPFLLQDAHGVSKRLKQLEEGNYKIDESRSAIHLPRTKAFPKNIELDVLLTFSGESTGRLLRSVTPTPEAVTVHQHHSFIELPDDNYKPRSFDPRAGVNALTYYDYTTPVTSATKKQVIYRHRLEKKDPKASKSEAVAPIIYYLDNGTPEPVRSALLEGGAWWNQAFESIGFENAFQIKILPDDADPLDVRYNVIQWIHRSTRGWSYGASIADPRTGEIIKGHVSLGSLRIRQDYMIALGLTKSPFEGGKDVNKEALNLALARIRQLSAHEIGHTLGFAHNFAASARNRSSVMDYPHPYIKLNQGEIDYSQAYETGIGSWDKISVAYAYSDFPEGTNESEALNDLLEESTGKGHRFISDLDARPIGGAHPLAHLWDNGISAYEELSRLMKIRNLALEQLSLEHLRNGEPYSTLEDRMVPIYLLHRYQIEAVAKLIGGVDYDYAVKGNLSYQTALVSATEQRNAFLTFLETLQPENLVIPSHLRPLLPPRSFSNPRTRENFLSKTGVTFDYLGVAHSLSNALLGLLLHPERANRLVTQYGFDSNQLGLEELLVKLTKAHFKVSYRDSHQQHLSEIVKANLLNQLMNLGQHPNSNSIVKAEVHKELVRLDQWLAGQDDLNFGQYYRELIDQYFDDPEDFVPAVTNRLPDGSPIGQFSCDN